MSGETQWQDPVLMQDEDGEYIVWALHINGDVAGALLSAMQDTWLEVQVWDGAEWVVVESRAWGATSIRQAQRLLERALVRRAPRRHGTIYKLLDPRDETIRYIGQTVGRLDERLASHITEARWARLHNARTAWLRDVLDAGYRPRIAHVKRVAIADIFAEEDRQIDAHRAHGCPLTNSRVAPRRLRPRGAPSPVPPSRAADADRWYSTAEAAVELGGAYPLRQVTVQKLCVRGAFRHAERRGRVWRIPARDLTPEVRARYANGARPVGGRGKRTGGPLPAPVPAAPTGEYLTTREAAIALDPPGGVSRELVLKMLREGHLPGAGKTGGDWLIPRSAITPDLKEKYADGARPRGGRPSWKTRAIPPHL